MIERPPMTIALLVLASACSVDEPGAAREEARNEPVAPLATKTKTIPAEDIPSPSEPSGTPIEGQDQERLRSLIQAMAAAAAEEGDTTGQSMCDRAFESTIRFAATLRESMGTAPQPEPDRAEFLAACNRLPENVQRCMVMAYSVSHQAECSRIRAELNATDRERVRQLGAALGRTSPPAQPEAAPPAPQRPATP